jgi:hypothetical protein
MRTVFIDTGIESGHSAANDELFCLSHHAHIRMSQRSIDLAQIQNVLMHGKMMHSRRARFYVVGKRDVKRLAKAGLDTQNLENIQVVVEEKSNTIVTVYRNRDFRHIRPTSRRQRHMG